MVVIAETLDICKNLKREFLQMAKQCRMKVRTNAAILMVLYPLDVQHVSSYVKTNILLLFCRILALWCLKILKQYRKYWNRR